MEADDQARRGLARRRVRASVPRRRQVVVRFSDAEMALVQSRAALARAAVGAWIGHTAVAAAGGLATAPVGLPDLLRLHADVVLLERSAASSDVDVGEHVAVLLARLDAAVDAIVAEAGRGWA